MNEEKLARPAFIEKLTQLHYARLARCVVLTGNIHDLFSLSEQGQEKFFSLEEILARTLKNARYPRENCPEQFIVMTLKSDGVHFGSPEDEEVLKKVDTSNETFVALTKQGISCHDAIRLFGQLLRQVAKMRQAVEKREGRKYIPPLCIVIDQANMILPNLTVGQMSSQDKDTWKCFYDLMRDESIWADDETADSRPDFFILLSPTIAELNPAVFSLPKAEPIEIAAPDENLIEAFTSVKLKRFPIPNFYKGRANPVQDFARDAQGLTLRTLDDLLTSAHRDPLNFVLDRKPITEEINKRIYLVLGEKVKFVRPGHTLDDVRGFRKLKARMKYLARLTDNPKRAPVGIVVPGPNGAGKTYFFEAWSVSTGRSVFTIAGGMRDKYYGVTEQAMETMEATVSAFSRTCIMIDEAHKAFGSLHDPDTFQAEALLARHVIQMMSNSKYRSKIFWVLITTRPDLLDPDFVRTGRCSLAVPMFDPEDEDADDFLNWMFENFMQEGIVLSEEDKEVVKQKTREPGREFSASDYRQAIDEYIAWRKYHKEELQKELSIKEFLESWKSSALKLGVKRELQLYLAARDCQWPELLPKRFQKEDGTQMDQGEIEARIEELKLLHKFSD